jgi:hypothetical protein
MTAMSASPSITELKQMLTQRVEDVVPRILRDVHAEGCDLVDWTQDGTKFKIVVRGRKRGFVLDTSAPHAKGLGRRGGNLFNLITHELADGTPIGGIAATKRLLGISAGFYRVGPVGRDHDAERRAAEIRRNDAIARVRRAAADADRRRCMAKAVWEKAEPMTPQTPAWRYLDARECVLPSDALRSG